ncbi:MAG: FAD-dependent oxidoreductase [Gemmatimonadota bacterium]|nr:FAD-dependent oxidoreductase [Gemmatimonadota bacterium]
MPAPLDLLRLSIPRARSSSLSNPRFPPISGTVVVGAGPAGLATAHELAERGLPAVVLERDDMVGGIARTVEYEGYRFDLGGHRFFTKSAEIQRLWERTLGEDFLVRPRLSRIHYRNRFFHYPLRPLDALTKLGVVESARVLASYARARMVPHPEERTFEQWVVNRFGRRLFEIFFETYTEKVWGIPCSEISADWAAQRIKNLDLASAVKNALFDGSGDRKGRSDEVVTTLIDRFHYPRLGPGMMWETWRDRVEGEGIQTTLESEVVRLHHRGSRVHAVDVLHGSGSEERVAGDHFVSTMPLRDLVRGMRPAAPPAVRAAAERLGYRDFLIVVLIADVEDLFPDNWIYIHSPDVRVGRIQNFKNWSPEMVPDPTTTSLGLEYFVERGGELWSAADEELLTLGAAEASMLGLLDPSRVVDGTVVRLPDAYPVYDAASRAAVAEIRSWLGGFENLYTIGRNGQHRYNNQDHSMLTGLFAARTIAGSPRPIWDVNVEAAYHEEVEAPRDEEAAEAAEPESDRLTPRRARRASVEEVLRDAFARYDPLALGAAVGSTAGATLFLATAWALIAYGPQYAVPPLTLLGHYLFGYTVSWGGAMVGTVEAVAGGFGIGWLLAVAINTLIGWRETVLRRELEALGTMDPLTLEEG